MASNWTAEEIEAELNNPNSQYDPDALRAILKKISKKTAVICQYTGIAFEAASKRQKNHPRVSDLLNSAAKSGTYSTAVERLAEARAAGMADLDEIIAYVHSGENEVLRQRNEAAAREAAARSRREGERRDAWRDREATNAILRQHGYHWQKEDEESMDAFGASAFQDLYGNASYVWLLIAPDGREVSVKQAMQELAQRGVVAARRWIDEHK